MKIFISHSSHDKIIAERFVDLISGVLGVNINDIFCSSVDGARISSTELWRESIKRHLKEANIIFLFISENYKRSEVCQNELGAAWMVDNANVIPLILEPITHLNVGVLYEVNQYEKLSDSSSLERIKDIILRQKPVEIQSDRWDSKKRKFIKKAKSYVGRLNTDSPDNATLFSESTEKLQRGGFTEFIVDSSLSHSQALSNVNLNKKLIADLQNRNEQVDLKFNYMGSLCAINWINLSNDPSYGHSRLVDTIRNNIDQIITECGFISNPSIDFISLGPGDGEIDKFILNSLGKYCSINTYYPLDISFDLLQTATFEIIQTGWLNKEFKIKPIHGDFTDLNNYYPIYGYDENINFFSLLGFTFGDFNESELMGKIKEGMGTGDFLLLDARLHEITLDTKNKITDDEKNTIIANYNNATNNRFAFGALESVTTADYNSTTFELTIDRQKTIIPGAVNIVTSCKNINTKFRHNGKTLRKNSIALTSTTSYNFNELESWFEMKELQVIWKKKLNSIGLFLLKKTS